MIAAAPDVEKRILKRWGDVVADSARRHLGRSNDNRDGHIHMADDVQVSRILNDRGGEKAIRVGGGKRTGTLWHLVESGTKRNKYNGRWFMTKALIDTEDERMRIVDEELGRGMDV